MQASIKLLSQDQCLAEFMFPYGDLTKSHLESYLSSNFGLKSSYEISYIDADGDEIAVEFDDDYEVAKLTHQDSSLPLNVKINDQDWANSFRASQNQSFEIQNFEERFSLKEQPHKAEVEVQIDIQQNPLPQSEQKIDLSLLEPLIEHLTQQQKLLVSPAELSNLDEEIISKPTETQETQILLSSHLPIHNKRTETQTSELQSVDELSQTKAPIKKPNFDFMQDGIPFVQEESQNQKPDVFESKAPSKPKEKKIKEKNLKPKKPKALTQKDIKKLVKKEVFKLLPQLAQKLKSANEVNQSSEPEFTEAFKSQENRQHNSDISACTICSGTLKIPFYVNSAEGIRMCERCQGTDDSTYPLIKIRNEAILEKLGWAQPLFYVSSSLKREENGQAKFYTDIKKQFIETIKVQFDSKIKTVKQDEKKKMLEKKNKERTERCKKQMKGTKQQSLI